jgi:hypothetical protein
MPNETPDLILNLRRLVNYIRRKQRIWLCLCEDGKYRVL